MITRNYFKKAPSKIMKNKGKERDTWIAKK